MDKKIIEQLENEASEQEAFFSINVSEDDQDNENQQVKEESSQSIEALQNDNENEDEVNGRR